MTLLRSLLTLILCAPFTLAAAECPADGGARLQQTRLELSAMARDAMHTNSPRCVKLGAALADSLDRSGAGACAAARKLDDETGAEFCSLRSLLEWRCGRPRAAHASALEALRQDEDQTLAWTVLGRVLEARFHDAAARHAYQEALTRVPGEPGALIGMAHLAQSRGRRREFLERYIEAGEGRGERGERLRSARENLALSCALGDRPVWVVDSANLPGSLPLRPIADRPGDLRAYLINLHLGSKRTIPTLLDSGASGLHLSPKTAQRAGVEFLSEGRLYGGGGSGEHQIERGIVKTVDLGVLVYHDGLAAVASRSLHPRGRYTAIIGMDLLGGLELVFDPGASRLSVAPLEQDPVCEDPLLANPWPDDPSLVPILRVEGQLLVPLRLSHEGWEMETLALFDTGASKSLVDLSLVSSARGFRRSGRKRARGYGGTMALEGEIHSLELSLGEHHSTLRRVPVIDLSKRAALAGIRVGAQLGLDVLSHEVCEIDLRYGMLRIR